MKHTPTDRAEPLPTDDRAVSEVLGAILIFGLVVALLVLIQVNAVPAANKQVEFEHHQRVTQDFQSLQEELYRVGATGTETAVGIETGIVYPQRFFLLNPPPSTGTFETTLAPPDSTSPNVFVRGSVATDSEVAQYWSGEQTFTTRGMRYRPDYNELPNPGDITWEHSLLYTRFGADTVTVQEPSAFLDGDRIRLTLVTGNVSQGGISTSVDLSAVSTRRRSIDITGTGTDPVEITVASDLSAEEWRTEVYSEEIADPTDELLDIVDAGSGRVTFELDPSVTYDLSITRVRVGSTGGDPPGAYYLTDVEGDDTSVGEGEVRRLVVEVRDRYNNPVSGVQLNTPNIEVDPGPQGADLTGDVVGFVGTGVTDENGRVVIEYVAPDADQVTADTPVDVEVTMPDGADAQSNLDPVETVTFDLTVIDTDAGAGGGGDASDGVSGINPTSGTLVYEQICKKSGNFYAVFDNPTGSTIKIDQARYLFYTGSNFGATGSVYLGPATLSRSGGFVTVGTSFQSGETLALRFEDTGGTGNINNDLFGISTQMTVGTTSTQANYFIQWPSNNGQIPGCNVTTVP